MPIVNNETLHVLPVIRIGLCPQRREGSPCVFISFFLSSGKNRRIKPLADRLVSQFSYAWLYCCSLASFKDDQLFLPLLPLPYPLLLPQTTKSSSMQEFRFLSRRLVSPWGPYPACCHGERSAVLCRLTLDHVDASEGKVKRGLLHRSVHIVLFAHSSGHRLPGVSIGPRSLGSAWEDGERLVL